eukprot:TRINITY_DN17387_c0_g1_i1.p1 TRINITY_DN17387_c0_g1~~TRINITY_DN17387_c0_g1_i1.p1  ORF type:complete len:341 (+),score=35.47 TRINITY_DN17387_c0_g1_i1:120-1142(+)
MNQKHFWHQEQGGNGNTKFCISITNLFLFSLYCSSSLIHAELTKECCNVSTADLEKFQHIRDLSHNFIIVIGVQKSGTTVVFSMIARHPKTKVAITKFGRPADGGARKELHFFDTPNLKFENYLKSFNLSALEKGYTMVEATPSYLSIAAGACLVKYLLPKAKLVVVLRNPAHRALSEFKMIEYQKLCHRLGGGPCKKPLPDFYAPMKKLIHEFNKRSCNFSTQMWSDCFGCYHKRNYVTKGVYGPQIKNWMEYLPREQFLVLNHADLHKRQETANKIYEFANLGSFELESTAGFWGIKHPPSENIQKGLQLLEEFYVPHNKFLFDLLEKDFKMYNFSFN